jgi:Putative beta-lactamase-inhibitor-like, PepSY-like
MKKLFVLFALALAVISCDEKKLKDKEVPTIVKEAFQKQFPSAKKAEWENEDGKFEVSFEQDDKEMSAVFTAANGALEETEVEIKKEELPAQALAYISQNYKDEKIQETAKITKANGEINFEAEVKGRDLIFDSNGNFLMAEEEDED